ncbi:FRS transcription factor family isoform 2 [Hibiscus syriacus]|uniref:Protein FAR1-RELATED SEQUENCE n=1 Tax=Hibiscus syriacus TaxID=106335 RepID=A0A6A2XNH4_HIBSY|nr:FRS transcription factor family isoform 2 [Hibiscus syriacus]
MGGNAPKVVLTDHDKALKEAVVEVFPDSRHCFCLWHILSKIPKKLSYVNGQHEDFMAKFDDCIFKSYTDEQFEKKWWELVDGFNLRNYLWFRSLYEDRLKWVPAYMRGIFLAGMSTMQRSDSVEVLGGIACHPRKESEEGGVVTFKVQDFEKNQDFVVLSGVQSIPSQHILKRWTKDARSRQTTGKQLDAVETRMHRCNDLCQRAFKLGDEGSLSQESYNIVCNALEEALRKCKSVNYSNQTVTRSMSPQTQGPHHFEEVNQNSSTTKAVKKTKTSLKRQGYPETEISNTGRCNNWQQVGVSNVQVPNLECSYESQDSSIHRMEQLNSRTPALNSYFGTQQLMPGMGQLNSIGLPHDAHYITQQRMNGMGQLPFRPQSIPGCHGIHGSQDMDQPNAGSSQLQSMTSRKLHYKHLSR